MAARYVEEMITLWPNGPYHLYGWSFGGVVAFEMAQLLRAGKREIGLLALADTPHPSWFEGRKEPREDEMMIHLLAEAGEMESAFSEKLKGMGLKDRLAYLRRRLTRESILEVGDPNRFARVYRANLQALSTYFPSPWKGKMVFLSAEEWPEAEEIPHLAWRMFARQFDHHVIPGNHFTLHRQPNVSRIVGVLDAQRAKSPWHRLRYRTGRRARQRAPVRRWPPPSP